MRSLVLMTFAAAAVFTIPAGAQNQRRAAITGGGNVNGGKCTIEVVVDGAADVEIRGDRATLRNLSGGTPEWRRFVCTGLMPSNVSDFRFQGVDGRGRQQLVRDPRNGGVAVIRIEDTGGGREGYTFDIMWGGGNNGGYNGPGGYNNAPYDNRSNDNRNYNNRDRARSQAVTDRAFGACREAVSRQAQQRFRTRNLDFGDMRMDDNPGRNDWIVGSFRVPRGNGDERYSYSCSVDFNDGRVRSAQIEPMNGSNRGNERSRESDRNW